MKLPTRKVKAIVKAIDFAKLGGIVPVVVADYKTKEVRMVAFMNQEALTKTLTGGRATYYSRTRKELWTKGATSGNIQLVKGVWLDCDNDTIILKIKQVGETCHTGKRICFYKRLA